VDITSGTSAGILGITIVIDAINPGQIQTLLPNAGPMHLGLIVPDLDRAVESYGRLFGWKWTSTVRVRHEIEGPCATEAELYVVFATGSPLVELIEDRPGTIWAADNRPLHHFGCWVRDLDEAGNILIDAGFTFRGRGRRVGTHRFAYAYYGDRNGLLLEIQDTRFRPGWQAWLDGSV